MISTRVMNAGIAGFCLALMLMALILQEVVGLHPCPLCITQRVFVVIAGLIALIACLHNPTGFGIKLYASFSWLAALAGAVVAGRHVWLQNLPEDQVPACGPGLEYMFENFPFQQAVQLLFMGDGNCADVVWTFLGLSIPAWVLVACMIILLANGWILLSRSHR